MALRYTAGTHRTDFGSAANLDNAVVSTMMVWFKRSSFTAYSYLSTKEGTHRKRLQEGSSAGMMLCSFAGNGGITSYSWSAVIPNNNTWYYGVLTTDLNAGAGAKHSLYIGTLNTLASLKSVNSVDSDNASSSCDDSTGNLVVGDGDALNNSFRGDFAIGAYWTGVRLSLEEIIQQQYSLVPVVQLSNLKMFCNLGWNGTSTQPDWSGNLNNGTVTGATLTDHVPIGFFSPPKANDLGPDSNVAIDISESNYNAWIPGVKVRG